ncbi:MAG: DUF370 domain-containing protein [Clostridia bacterium]|nr:DUF370 domain-containing protein [Clostridia bacterium]
MYLHLGQEVVVRHSDIIGVFDMDNTTISPHTREYLRRAEIDGRVTYVSMELPKSFTVCAPKGRGQTDTVYISQIAPSTLRKRAKRI